MRLQEIFDYDEDQPEWITDKEAVEVWCWKMKIENYVVNEKGEVTVHGDVNLNARNLTHIPVQFDHVYGDFDIGSNRKLTSLKGSPRTLSGEFHFGYCAVTCLEHGPAYVGGSYYGPDNGVLSLKGAPKEVGAGFTMHNNFLTSLEGGPKKVAGIYDVDANPIKTLRWTPEEVGESIDMTEIKTVTSLVGISHTLKKVGDIFTMQLRQVQEGGMGLIMVEGLKEIWSGWKDDPLPAPFKIIAKYLGRPDDIFECQAELIDNGFEAYAQL